MLDEFSLIDFIKKEFEDKSGFIGDDCAIYGDFLISLDQMVEGTHFIFSKFPPNYLGKKVVSSTLSDIAAMGGIPLLLFLGVVIKKDVPFKWFKKFLVGVKEECIRYGIVLAGGDLSRGENISITATVIGKKNNGRVLLRSGAKIGDYILATHSGGFACLGMKKLYEAGFVKSSFLDRDVRKFIQPDALIDIGKFLLESEVVNSCIDISDGILRDLKNLCRESNLSAILFLDELDGLLKGKSIKRDIFLKGGEEYELLFSVERGQLETFQRKFSKKFDNVELFLIGEMIERKDFYLYSLEKGDVKPFFEDGFDHFGGGIDEK